MRKMLSAGVLLVLGSLGAVQAHGQQAVTAPIVEQAIATQTQKSLIEYAKEAARYADQKVRELKTLATELEQLQIAAKNAKRASPQLWDSSLNAFENIANGSDQVDSILNAAGDFGEILKRSGCLNGVVSGATFKDGVGGKTLAQGKNIDFYATPKPDELIAARKRNELEGRCQRLVTGLKAKQEIEEAARTAADQTADHKEDASSDESKGMQATLDHLLAAMNTANTQAMQSRRDALNAREADEKRAMDELERQRSMHDRLMKAPSSSKKVEARNPTLTVDPNNY